MKLHPDLLFPPLKTLGFHDPVIDESVHRDFRSVTFVVVTETLVVFCNFIGDLIILSNYIHMYTHIYIYVGMIIYIDRWLYIGII